MSGKSVFLTGAPGSGKTYVLNQFIQAAKKQKSGLLLRQAQELRLHTLAAPLYIHGLAWVFAMKYLKETKNG